MQGQRWCVLLIAQNFDLFPGNIADTCSKGLGNSFFRCKAAR
jgi:hypothetical protein